MATPESNDQFLRHMALLREQFVKKLPGRFDAVRSLWNQWRAQPEHRATLEQLHREVHGLAGAGGTFGFAVLSTAARALDTVVKDLIDDGRAPGAVDEAQFAGLLDAVEKSMHIGTEQEQWLHKQSDLRNTFLDVGSRADQPRLVMVCESDAELARELERKLSFFGYSVKTCATLSRLSEALGRERPALVLVSAELPDGNAAEFMATYRLQHPSAPELPTLFMSAQADFRHRLQAVRSGAVAFMVKPPDIAELIDHVNGAVYPERQERDRIMIVDDSDSYAEHAGLLFKQAGYEVDVVTDPSQVLDRMCERAPDLILMDLYMPVCNGFELAKVIRQHAAFVSIPIVYVSAETNINKKLELIMEGGDDYITKPINEIQLLSAVRGRLRRSQLLRGMMMRDSLTGLLNHTAVTEKLELEVTRAERLGSPLTFVMIDVDHFKHINDTFGHPCGDRVIKTIARLLRQRLRRTDIIGRYGGEEFAAVLLDTSIETARDIIDEIRQGLADVVFHDGDQPFHVTFSAGLASYPPLHTAQALCDAADLALYKAKRDGRNRVECHC